MSDGAVSPAEARRQPTAGAHPQPEQALHARRSGRAGADRHSLDIPAGDFLALMGPSALANQRC